MGKSNIQDIILAKLLYSPVLRYSEIRPKSTENDLFNYHLQFLVKKGLVDKVEQGYRLSDLGIYSAVNERLINTWGQKNDLHKINCLNLVLKKDKLGNYLILNHMRKRYPYMNYWGISGGPLKRGEKVFDGAKRTLRIKTGLDGDFTDILLHFRAVFYHKGRLFQDIFYYVCLCTKYKGDLISEYDHGINKWMTIQEVYEREAEAEIGFKALLGFYKEFQKKGKPTKISGFTEQIINLNSLR